MFVIMIISIIMIIMIIMIIITSATTQWILTSIGPTECERAGRGSQGRVAGVSAGGGLTGRGVGVRPVSVRFALIFIHSKRRESQLLPKIGKCHFLM